MGEFRMPSLGADMERGTLDHWYVKPGDRVKRGDLMAVIHTDKGAIDVEVFEDGVVERLVARPGESFPVGEVLAVLGGGGPAPREASAQPARERLRVSPVARRVAAELGVDLATVTGTGPHGVIQKADVERVAAARTKGQARVAAARDREDAAAGMRRAIAAAMARSNRDIPHYYLQSRIDASRTLRWLEEENRKRSLRQRLLPAVPLIRAACRALKEVPELNGFWVDDRLEVRPEIHLGFAIALRTGGLVTPALRDAGGKGPDEVMEALRDLIDRARGGRLRASELTDATITLTSLGDLGVETVFGVIYPPQVALVGLGRISEQPWAEGGMIGVRPVLTATVAGDHRATDGLQGARFLDAFNQALQHPEEP